MTMAMTANITVTKIDIYDYYCERLWFWVICRFHTKDGIPSETSFPSVTSLPSYYEIRIGRVFARKPVAIDKKLPELQETRWNPSRIHIRRGTRLKKNPSSRVFRLLVWKRLLSWALIVLCHIATPTPSPVLRGFIYMYILKKLNRIYGIVR